MRLLGSQGATPLVRIQVIRGAASFSRNTHSESRRVFLVYNGTRVPWTQELDPWRLGPVMGDS